MTRSTPAGERGESTVQLVVLTPLLVLMIVLAIQTAVFFHASNVATAAASRGATEGSHRGARERVAAESAERIVDELGSTIVGAPQVSESSGDVVVTVTVEVPRLLPFAPDTVTRTVRQPRERFIAEADR